MSDNWYRDEKRKQESYEDAADYDRVKPRKLSGIEQEYRAAQETERQDRMGRRLKTLKERQYSRGHPVRTRARSLVSGGEKKVVQSFQKTSRTMRITGPSKIRRFISGAFGTSSKNYHSGLSTIVDEVARSYPGEMFDRPMLPENNEEKDFFGGSSIDMNNLTGRENDKNKKELI